MTVTVLILYFRVFHAPFPWQQTLESDETHKEPNKRPRDEIHEWWQRTFWGQNYLTWTCGYLSWPTSRLQPPAGGELARQPFNWSAFVTFAPESSGANLNRNYEEAVSNITFQTAFTITPAFAASWVRCQAVFVHSCLFDLYFSYRTYISAPSTVDLWWLWIEIRIIFQSDENLLNGSVKWC